MLVPANPVASRWPRYLLGLPLLFLLIAPPGQARGPVPIFRIPLDVLGFLPPTAVTLLDGSTMLTVHFVDEEHLLVTFNARTLLQRIPDDPPTDQDRNVAALLLELPSGRILARTQWRFHDHGQYLWSLGHGRFLLRTRDTLTTIAPLANLHTPEPFHQRPFLPTLNRHIGYLFLTPDADLLTLETKDPAPAKPAPKQPLFGPTPVPVSDDPPTDSTQYSNPTPVQINFYRLDTPGPGDEVRVFSAGLGRSRYLGPIFVSTSGYLDLIDQGHHTWAFNFDSYTGKINELSAFDSTCQPLPAFVSHSEFIAFGCHLGQTRQIIGGFNMRGDEMWQQNLYGDYLAASLVYAPSSGRFALSRIITKLPNTALDTLSADELTAQSVTVFQADSGNQVLKIDCTPIERAGQNFALSPDGMSFAVIRNDAIEVYKLPSLTSKEQATLKLTQSAAPELTDVPVRLFPQSPDTSPNAPADAAADAPAPTPDLATTPPPVTAPPVAASPAPASTSPTPNPATTQAANPPDSTSTSQPESDKPAPPENSSGDPESQQPRKPPTLYTLPADNSPGQQNDQPK